MPWYLRFNSRAMLDKSLLRREFEFFERFFKKFKNLPHVHCPFISKSTNSYKVPATAFTC